MTATKTNERPGTRAVLRYARVSPYKVREVLDLVRNLPVDRARDTLELCERDAAELVRKVLNSAVANAEANDGLDPEELYVAACYADEGTTIKRWRPRARGRATRIRKRTCHVTVIVGRLPEEQLVRMRARRAADEAARRARRVAATRRSGADTGDAAAPGGSRLRRRRGRGRGVEAPVAVDPASVEEEGIVDQQAAAVAAVTEQEEPVPVEDETTAEGPPPDAPPAGDSGSQAGENA
jgi:large subunit ribosomal protein L22